MHTSKRLDLSRLIPIIRGEPVRAIYTDGGVIGRNPAPAGTWAYRLVASSDMYADEREVMVEASGVLTAADLRVDLVTNNHTELAAMLMALQAVPENWGGLVCSDSEVTLGRVFRGWKTANTPEWMVKRIHEVRARLDLSKIVIVQLDGHPTAAELARGYGKHGNWVSPHNVWCDAACTAAGQAWRERSL